MRTEKMTQDRNIKLAIALKTNQLRREQLSSLTYQHVESALIGKWKFEKIDSLHEAVNDILKLNANDIVVYLSAEAAMLGNSCRINDFEDLFGGDMQ